jgi:4-nitrophenol 2-monooxygenase / 4-nitrocatechol 4-monooxygenase, reductase component
MIDDSEFRRVMGHFASGVAVVTTRDAAGRPCGLTASALCSVSLDPTLILVSVEREADTHGCLESSGYYAVSILGEEGGERLARRFGTYGVEEKLEGIAYREEATGAPVLDEALAWVDCRVTQAVEAGDHTLFIGEVLAGDARSGAPLVYFRGGYGRFLP